MHGPKDWWVKNNVTWFLMIRGQIIDKIYQCTRNRTWSSLLFLDNRKWKNFNPEDNNGKLCVEVITVAYLEQETHAHSLQHKNLSQQHCKIKCITCNSSKKKKDKYNGSSWNLHLHLLNTATKIIYSVLSSVRSVLKKKHSCWNRHVCAEYFVLTVCLF